MNRLKKLLAITTLIAGVFLVLSPAMALAQNTSVPAATSTGNANKDAVCQGLTLSGGSCDKSTAQTDVQNIIKTVINILSLLVGVVSVIMIIVGGFKYVTSGGDSNGVNSAKNTILYALIGLIIAALAQVMVLFVLGRLVPK